METFLSQKGKEIAAYTGYRYRQDKQNSDGSTSWRCLEKSCRGRLKKHIDGAITVISQQNHGPSVEKIEVEKAKCLICERSVTTVERPRHIVMQCSSNLSAEATTMMPAFTASQRTIERKRKREQIPLPTPQSLQDITVPATLVVTSRNDNFLLWDSGAGDNHRMFLFGTDGNLELLETHPHWFIDGTFKVAPELFVQVFTVHALIDHSAVPLIYALLPSKQEAEYVRLFRKLLELRPTLAPQSVMSDFEKASQNAVSTVFPATRLVGCLFHLGQCLWRKLQDENLVATYRDDENVRLFVKMLLALSFVPPADVNTAFEELNDARPDVLENLYDYWEDNYIGRQRRNRRVSPRFPVTLWNVRDRVQDNLPRTNNSVEGWHHAFQLSVDGHHPNVYKLINHFRREQEYIENRIQRYNAGERSKAASKTKYIQLNRRLAALLPTYGNRPLMEFLRGIAYNLTL